jgi:hypothetical protein
MEARHGSDSETVIARRRTRRSAGVMIAVPALAALLLAFLCAAVPARALDLGRAPDLAAAEAALRVDARAAGATAADAERAAGITAGASVLERADALREAADAAQGKRLFTRATTLYERARALYLSAGARTRARACLREMQDIFMYVGSYSATRAETLAALAEMYPSVPAGQRAAWLDLPSTESLRWDDARHYFIDLPINLAYRDVELFQTLPAHVAGYEKAYEMLQPYLAAGAAAPPWQPYAEPREYDFTQTLSVPRAVLPPAGDLRAWLPLPIVGGPQSDVRITGLTPSTWCPLPPSIAQDIGLLYLHVPLEQLAGDLDVSFDVSYSHAAQYFKVDPATVGAYDKRGDLYRRYTASRGNTAITASIRRTARQVVGGATNPYSKARRLYRYVLDEVKYSYMPHLALWPRGIPESVYVHRHKYGDCGAQSIYFAALCRAVGVPARCTGGFQTFTGRPSGHFWAEFYLPDYGWIPVDPTAATLVDYLQDVSPADKTAFHDFFFARQDDLRLVVQKDVDLPLVPRAGQRVALPMAIQFPAATCDAMTDVPGLVLNSYWSFGPRK